MLVVYLCFWCKVSPFSLCYFFFKIGALCLFPLFNRFQSISLVFTLSLSSFCSRQPLSVSFPIYSNNHTHTHNNRTPPPPIITFFVDHGHLLHMASHIDMEVGKYGEAVLSNQKAVAADLIYCGLRGHFTYYHGYLVILVAVIITLILECFSLTTFEW